ncbi:hypothetical protein BLA60_37195, partial [Actinophytocola xinjiangensis]
WGVIHTLRAFLPAMVERGEGGHVVVALVAFLTGPAPAAVRLRRAIGRPGPVGRWVHANRGPLRWLVVGAAAVVFVFLDRPGAVAVALLALAVALCLAVIRVLDRPPAR